MKRRGILFWQVAVPFVVVIGAAFYGKSVGWPTHATPNCTPGLIQTAPCK